MDFSEKLAAVEQKIDDLVKKQTALLVKKDERTITSKESVELKGVDKLLKELKDSKSKYFELIKLSIKEEPESMSFRKAQDDWIREVTGVNTTYRKWTTYVIDEEIFPREGFKEAFQDILDAWHMRNEAGRRVILNLFLQDVVLRSEFNGVLRIFPEIEMEVQSNGPKKRKINGKTDYTIGFGKGMDKFGTAPPRELHVVAVEAKTSFGDDDLWQCVAETATLYKSRKDADKRKKSVWGVLSNARLWQFIHIDEEGKLWRTDEFSLDLQAYDELKANRIYRLLHFIVKCCHEACTPPPSTNALQESLNASS